MTPNTIKHEVPKHGTVGFFEQYAAKLSLEEFQAQNQHHWPNLTVDERNAVMKTVHENILKSVAIQEPATEAPPVIPDPSTKTTTNDNTGGNVETLSGDQPGTGNGGRGGKKS